jgi:urease subunit gamma/beta
MPREACGPPKPRSSSVASLRNTGPLPIWVSSHVPLDRLNAALEVDLVDAGHYRLDVPAGVAVKVDPDEVRTVAVVELVGGRS